MNRRTSKQGDRKSTVAVVVPTHNRRLKLKRLLDSLANGAVVAERTVVVADCCCDGTVEMLSASFPDVEVIVSDVPLYSAGARALGLARVTEDYVLFVDDDNVVGPECLRELVAAMASRPNLGLVGPVMMRYPKDTGVWCAGAYLTRTGVRYRTELEVLRPGTPLPPLTVCDFLPNAFLGRRTALAAEVPFDAKVFPHNWSEADLGVRMARAGYEVAVTRAATVWHDVGYSGWTTRLGRWQVFDQARSRLLFRRRFPGACGSWLQFWLVTFPISTVYYLLRFASAGDFRGLTACYIRGTMHGARADASTGHLHSSSQAAASSAVRTSRSDTRE